MGFLKYSYPAMAISAYGISFLIAVIVQQFILKNKEVLIVDYISMLLVISGLLFMIFRKEITKFFS